jgi:hypothetical protein
MRSTALALLPLLLLGCGDDAGGADASPEPDAAPNAGTVTFTWTIDGGGTTVDCAAVGALTVSFVGQEQDSISVQTDSFGCTSGAGTTRLLPVGTYTIDIDLRAAGTPSRSLLAAPIRVTGVEVKRAEATDIGPLVFEVAPTGSFRFRADANVSGSNCGDGDNDAGIEDMLLELRDAAGTCVPATFAFAGGGECATNCTDVVPCACQEPATEITVASSPSGPHMLSVVGRNDDGIACWTRLSSFTVPGNELDVDLGTLLLNRDVSQSECE